eukprot:TRINITY_DN63406_c0_g3_i1.p1 TRINITY_DN63406_c0_g3~~TRINITY_DN63406_c0_g3_i1.p1  ORF type:complete len:635 (+),score=92.49 TRINITY_DN63406_c0_g3_i1:124-2028(+)
MFRPLEDKAEEELDRGCVSDVCLGAGPHEEVRLFSSRAVLALASPVFRQMLFAPHWQEPPTASSSSRSLPQRLQGGDSDDFGKFRPGQHVYIAVKDVEPDALRCVLRYVSHLDPRLSLDNALHVFRAADKYQIDGLLEACSQFLDGRTDPRDVDQTLRLFDVACRLGLDSWKCRFLNDIGELSRLETMRLLNADEFLALHSASMAALLSSEGLRVCEEPLWHALLRWAEAQLAALDDRLPELSPEGPEDSRHVDGADLESVRHRPTSWQAALRPLRHLIRFSTMDPSFFAREVAQTGVLEPEESVRIFCKSAARLAGDLPGSCRSLDISELSVETEHGGSDSRVPQLGWCSAPGVNKEDEASEEGGLKGLGGRGGFGASYSASEAPVAVLDGRGLFTGAWGSRIVLGGPGTRFHFAFGTSGFVTGRHAWTISWRPLAENSRGSVRGETHGGAAGVAREGDGFGVPTAASSPSVPGTSMTGLPRTGSGLAGSTGPSSRASAATATSGGGGASARDAAARDAAAAAAAAVAAGASSDDPSARFLDWSSCVVFGTKRDMGTVKRYIPWDPVDADEDDGYACVKFAIVLDFFDKTVSYIADRGERRWTAPLTCDGRLVYPVVAASQPHYFHIRYGVHL